MEQDVNKNNGHLQSLLIVHAIEQCSFAVVKQTQDMCIKSTFLFTKVLH